jgi:hypothetical protein
LSDNAKITATIKGGKDFDAPWIVVHADTAAEARDILGEVEASGLLVDVGRVAKGLKAQHLMGAELGARPVDAPQTPAQAPAPSWGDTGTQQWQQAPQQAPQQQQGWGNRPEANPNDNKQCIHGPMTYRPAGISRRTNQPYAAFWACGSNVKGCKAIN